MIKLLKPLYVVRPYKVGSKTGNSTAIVIPSEVVKEYGIDTSTLLALRPDPSTKEIYLQVLSNKIGIKNISRADDNSKFSSQHVSYQEMCNHG